LRVELSIFLRVFFPLPVFNGSRSFPVTIALRCLIILAAIVPLVLFLTPTLYAAPPQTSQADQALLNAANHDRVAAGLPSLKWDPALAAAAHQHALRMAQSNQLSHQLPGEPPMQDRARHAGARFSLIAENVAQGPTVLGLHTQWMNSAPHRANLLDPELNAVGISVVQSGNTLFAVEDFSTAVPTLSVDEQEQEVAPQIERHGMQVTTGSADARKTCELDRGWAGPRPASVLRYEMSDLSHLPDEVMQKVASGKFHSAAVGACNAGGATEFARFRVAILLF
jgi:Cysteine-rich secretory protein family